MEQAEAVSLMLSPLVAEELSRASSADSTPPPSFCIAASKENRVRVLGSKNSVARIRPRKGPVNARKTSSRSIRFADSKSPSRNSESSNCRVLITCLSFSILATLPQFAG